MPKLTWPVSLARHAGLASSLLKSLLLAWLFALSLLGSAKAEQAAAGSVAEPTTRVMLLVSYHAGMAWSDEQIAGLRSELARYDRPLKLSLDFLDTKNVQPLPAYQQQLEDLLLSKYGLTPPRLLLATDDDALDLALRMRARHFPAVPILFSGVSGSRRASLQDEGNISGVFDDVDDSQNLALMLKLLPRTRRVVIVHDQSRTSLAQVSSLAPVLAQRPGLQVEHLTRMSVQEVQTRLRALSGTDLVLALPFNLDAQGRVISHEEASELWAEASTAPLTVTRDVSMRPGVLGGFLVTGRQQGEHLGRLAVQVLQGKSADELPMLTGLGEPTFEHQQLRRWGIDEAALPKSAVVLHRPTNWWADLRPYLGWLFSLFGSLLVIIALLINGIRLRHRSEQAMRQSTQNYLALFNSSSDAILVRDGKSLAIIDVNPRFCSLYGYSPDEARLLSASQLSDEANFYTGAMVAERIDKARNEGPQFFEWRSRRKDGSHFWADVSLTSFKLPEGERIISTVRDISDRKQLETQAQAFQHQVKQIYQNLPVAVFVIDAQHRVSFWNEQMTRLTGVEAKDIIGSHEAWRGIYPTARPCLVDAVVDGLGVESLTQLYGDQLRSSDEVLGAMEGESCIPAQGERAELWLRFCAAPLRDEQGQVVGAIETVIDVTVLKRTQESLQALNQQLEARVEARSHELELAMEQLLQADKMAALGSLVAGVAHELNTPLGNVLTVASTIADTSKAFGQELLGGRLRRAEVEARLNQLHEASLLIERNAKRAAKLVADFKQIAVDQSSTHRREFALQDLVNDTLSMLSSSHLLGQVQIQVDIDPGIHLHSFPGPLEQILSHLLTNSVKHGFEAQAEGCITIQAQAQGTEVSITYADNGCGIAPAALRHLFEPFYTTRFGQGGSGLGLYIVYNLVTSVLGGRIEVSSKPGFGCRFDLHLPLYMDSRSSGT
ncbi:PAS domain S-box protein [Paucibacter sp. TC2R-5]|uniref:sensor histidine kinase n=1 Tax=Paucibacter sp. TC2R-5 TaxID=2893555 RepID=UPI0021E4CF0D|nr:ABC transporter substrate binding protein [Paucibacter sp. TC2R-5]MCV2359776.1 PAS domain S-box protein [Paucibacter sp. TC2R-5]